jgi:hypothetical protein
MPALAVRDVFNEFGVPYSMLEHARILAEQWVGPVYTLLVVLPCGTLSLVGKKRIPWWSWLLGMVGPIYTVFAASGISHDFSHTLFQECSGIYGGWIQGLCIAGGLALAALAGMAFTKTSPISQQSPTSRGHRFLRLGIPAGAVLLGLIALATGCHTEFQTSMVGKPMMLYGAAFILIGLATFGLPIAGSAVSQDKAKRHKELSLRRGLALGAALLMALAAIMI